MHGIAACLAQQTKSPPHTVHQRQYEHIHIHTRDGVRISEVCGEETTSRVGGRTDETKVIAEVF